MRHIPKFKRNLSGALAILCLGIASSLHAQTIELNDDLEVLNFIKPLADVRAARDALSEQYQCGDTAYPGSEPSIAGMDGFDELRCGLALAKGGKMERAAELLKTAIARFPEDSRPFYELRQITHLDMCWRRGEPTRPRAILMWHSKPPNRVG